jgi:hypothetical protein
VTDIAMSVFEMVEVQSSMKLRVRISMRSCISHLSAPTICGQYQ